MQNCAIKSLPIFETGGETAIASNCARCRGLSKLLSCWRMIADFINPAAG